MADTTTTPVESTFTAPFPALDVPAVNQSGESAEIIAFKEKVAEVAKTYGERHGWCSTVNDALRDMGITPETSRIVVAFESSLIGKGRASVSPSTLRGKSAEEQAVAVAQSFGGASVVAKGRTVVNLAGADFAKTFTEFTLGTVPQGTPAEIDGVQWFDVQPDEGVTTYHLLNTASLAEQYVADARHVTTACGYSYLKIADLAPMPQEESKRFFTFGKSERPVEKCVRCARTEENGTRR